MTPEELGRYLAVMRSSGVAMGKIVLSASVAIDVTFGLDVAPLDAGTPPTPGGWKGPERLDADLEERVP